MFEWWTKLDPVTQWFYGAAVFFSVFFVWQFIAALVGLGGGEDVEVDAGADVDVGADMDVDADVGEIEAASAGDAAESVSAFRLLSVRSILAFATMFFWAGALYMQLGTQTTWAVIYGTFWGLGGFAAVAIVVNVMRRLTETGTPRLATALGRPGRPGSWAGAAGPRVPWPRGPLEQRLPPTSSRHGSNRTAS